MSYNIYVLNDWVNTKIGITSNIVSRMKTYSTHNPKTRLIKSYECLKVTANSVESCVKKHFNTFKVDGSTEWFNVPSKTVCSKVEELLNIDLVPEYRPSAHHIPLDDKADNLINTLNTFALDTPTSEIRQHETMLLHHIAKRFNIGTYIDYGNTDNIIHFERPCTDTRYADHYGEKFPIRKIAKGNNKVYNFYSLVPAGPSFQIAVCTAQICIYDTERMPKKAITNLVDYMDSCGWNCSGHNEWAWRYRNLEYAKPGLFVFQIKSSINKLLELWQKSFKFYVIVNQKRLELHSVKRSKKFLVNREEQEKSSGIYKKTSKKELLRQKTEYLKDTMEDIINDPYFPLDLKSYDDIPESKRGPIAYEFDYNTHFKHGDIIGYYWERAQKYLIDSWLQDIQ